MQHKPQPHDNQAAFDNVWQHFIAEKHGPCMTALGHCRYRSQDGTNGCAIGCQIPDELATRLVRYGYERATVERILEFHRVGSWFDAVSMKLLVALQTAHDGAAAISRVGRANFRTELKHRLHAIAAEFHLHTPTLF
jgi:hypothetical protein